MVRESVETRIGHVALDSGYPTTETVAMLYDELDFQRAVQAFIWAVPAVSLEALRVANARDWSVGSNEVGLVDGYTGPSVVGLTPNSTTIYAASFIDLSDGPIVVESPAGAYGVIDDIWQRPISEVGPFGPDEGKGGRFLLVPPGIGGDLPDDVPQFVVRSTTNTVLYLVRGIVRDGDVDSAVQVLRQIRIFPLSQAGSSPETIFRTPDGRRLNSVPPRDFAYWELLAGLVQREVVEERDRFFHAMLKPLGIEKGKSFEPDDRQRRILSEAAEVGFLMAQAISLEPRFDSAVGYPGTQWEWVLNLEPNQESEYSAQLDERTDYTFEAITVAAGMVKPIVGAGSQYMSVAKDSTGTWLDGSNTYRLHVPAGVPVLDFWSVTVYDNLTRSMIDTPTQRAAVSSGEALVIGDDGSIDLFFGPEERDDPNWIRTIPGRGWFAYFRWYGPTQEFFDQVWTLPDVDRL